MSGVVDSMEIDAAKQMAVANARKAVASYLTRPEHLDKVEQNRRRIMRNKASVDTRLKTAVQSQVDGIRSGLQELKSAQGDITSIREIIGQVNEIFNECAPLTDKLAPVLVASNIQVKLSKTDAHLKQIFNVPETVAKTKDHHSESKFLEAHKNIIELESTRDELLFELHKLAKKKSTHLVEESPIFAYFKEVAELSKQLWKQLATVIDRLLDAARSKPSQIVTAMRIIEREERSDKRCCEEAKLTGFMPPGRPKNYKNRMHECLAKSVQNRFDSNQLELSDKTVKMWLVRHLERMRKLILDDLLIVKV
jgi:exocyst complex component 3